MNISSNSKEFTIEIIHQLYIMNQRKLIIAFVQDSLPASVKFQIIRGLTQLIMKSSFFSKKMQSLQRLKDILCNHI
ncbi:MAG: hypothetical protein CO189_08845 [candidate division Zixibacteria bacterium CG_4_9_14_3_um_filter_46_8]|nr:MAG: hypothetical protein CO189_08845 [candidate division Zixibacteria bacterium CG_4_9_14_3_um_filter_46_8]